MLAPREFLVGSFSQTDGLTFVLPRDQYEHAALVSRVSGQRIAVILKGEHQFVSFGCENNTSWQGVLVPGVTIEVDETSIVNAYAPLGALVRIENELRIMTKPQGDFARGSKGVALLNELPLCEKGMSACFARWSVVIGEGLTKRTIMTIDVVPDDSAPS